MNQNAEHAQRKMQKNETNRIYKIQKPKKVTRPRKTMYRIQNINSNLQLQICDNTKNTIPRIQRIHLKAHLQLEIKHKVHFQEGANLKCRKIGKVKRKESIPFAIMRGDTIESEREILWLTNRERRCCQR